MAPELKMGLERFLVARVLAVLIVGGACATGTAAQEAARPRIAEINVTGGIGQGWASFDESSVWAPWVQVSRRQDGSWAGRVAGRPMDAHMENDELVIGRSLRVSVLPVREGYLVTYRGLDKELVISCAPGDTACADAASRPAALEQCKPYGCGRVTYAYVYAAPAQPPVAQMGIALLPRNGW
jgi:hypothetical protein